MATDYVSRRDYRVGLSSTVLNFSLVNDDGGTADQCKTFLPCKPRYTLADPDRCHTTSSLARSHSPWCGLSACVLIFFVRTPLLHDLGVGKEMDQSQSWVGNEMHHYAQASSN